VDGSFPDNGQGRRQVLENRAQRLRDRHWLDGRAYHQGRVSGITVTGPQWTQLCWNDDNKDYDLSVAEGINTIPIWPEGLRLQNSLKLGFREKTIADEDHPYMRQLRGLTD
jgi:hypothetical protein